MRKALYILGQMNDEDVNWMTTVGRKEVSRPGETILEQGEQNRSMYLVLDGELAVFVQSMGTKAIDRMEPGEIFGDISFVDSQPSSATVQAIRNSSLLALSHDSIHLRMEEVPAFTGRFFRAIALFMASRLRQRDRWKAIALGKEEPPEQDEEYEVTPLVLEKIHLASARFETIRTRMG